MKAKLDCKAVETIEQIVNRGNKAVIQRSGHGLIVMEERRQIKYRNDTSENKNSV